MSNDWHNLEIRRCSKGHYYVSVDSMIINCLECENIRLRERLTAGAYGIIWVVIPFDTTDRDNSVPAAFTFRAGAEIYRQLKKNPSYWKVVEMELLSSLGPDRIQVEKELAGR